MQEHVLSQLSLSEDVAHVVVLHGNKEFEQYGGPIKDIGTSRYARNFLLCRIAGAQSRYGNSNICVVCRFGGKKTMMGGDDFKQQFGQE